MPQTNTIDQVIGSGYNHRTKCPKPLCILLLPAPVGQADKQNHLL